MLTLTLPGSLKSSFINNYKSVGCLSLPASVRASFLHVRCQRIICDCDAESHSLTRLITHFSSERKRALAERRKAAEPSDSVHVD